MKIARRVALYFFGIALVLMAGEFLLWGAEDPFANFGVHKLDEKVDALEFVLSDLNGRNRSSRDFEGKFIMLNFWATW